MLYFQHILSGEVLVSTPDHLVWRWTHPNHTPTRTRSVHLWTRQAPDQGHPEQECALEAISHVHLATFLEEISFRQAYHLDPHLVEYIGRVGVYPRLPTVLRQLPPGSYLRLVACACSREEEFFEIYRVDDALEQHLTYLNPLLEPLLPWKEIDGVRRFVVPCPTHVGLASRMLVLALERCLWGINALPTYSYAYGYELEP